MKNKKKAIGALLFRTLGLFIGITAITLQLFTNKIIGKGFMSNHVLAYFTLQTNIFTTLIFLYLVGKTIYLACKTKELEIAHMKESINLAFTYYITITMLGYWILLAPTVGLGDDGLSISNTLFLHTFTPLMAIFDVILFLNHGKINKRDAFIWLLYPVIYLISVIIIANTSNIPYYKFPIGDKVISLMYPYPFLDPQVVTLGGAIGVMLALVVFALAGGYGYICLDHKIAKHMAKKKTI